MTTATLPAPTVTDAMREAARGRLRHAPECHPTAAAYVETRGAKGDALLRCTSCRRFYVMATATPPAASGATPGPVAPPVASVAPEPMPVDPEPAEGPQEVTAADVDAAATIEHRTGCTGTAWRVTDARTDRLVICRGCGRFAKAGPSAAPAVLPPSTRWVCGGHPDVPVTWRGTGCPECARELAASIRARAARRRERLRPREVAAVL